MCGWRRISLSAIDWIESAIEKRPSSSQICARNTASNRKSPSSCLTRVVIAAVERVEQLVGFLQHERPQRLQRLLAIPGAAVLGAQRAHDLDQLLKARTPRVRDSIGKSLMPVC